MKQSKFKRFIQVFLIATMPLFLAGCLDHIGGCAPDFEKNEARFYVVNLNGGITAVERSWSENGHGALVTYGLDDSQNYLYYTDNFISSPEEIIQLNYQTGSVSKFILDEDGQRFSLSPNGNLFAYERIQQDRRSADISIASISDTLLRLAPRDSAIKSSRSPMWISNDEIVYKAYGESDGLGIFKVNIADSTIEQLTDLTPRWGYSLYNRGEVIVFSAESVGDNGFRQSSIFIKKKDESKPHYVAAGTYPRIIPSKEKFIFDTLEGIWLSDFDGNTELLYSDGNSYSVNRNLAISPDGNSIVIAKYEGLFIIDLETKKVTQLTEKRDFVSENGAWESINSSFNSPVFSADGMNIFFSITLNYFDNGC